MNISHKTPKFHLKSLKNSQKYEARAKFYKINLKLMNIQHKALKFLLKFIKNSQKFQSRLEFYKINLELMNIQHKALKFTKIQLEHQLELKKNTILREVVVVMEKR